MRLVLCMFQLMTGQFEMRFSVLAPDGVLAAAYIVGTEEFVAIGAGFCGVRQPDVFYSCDLFI